MNLGPSPRRAARPAPVPPRRAATSGEASPIAPLYSREKLVRDHGDRCGDGVVGGRGRRRDLGGRRVLMIPHGWLGAGLRVVSLSSSTSSWHDGGRFVPHFSCGSLDFPCQFPFGSRSTATESHLRRSFSVGRGSNSSRYPWISPTQGALFFSPAFLLILIDLLRW